MRVSEGERRATRAAELSGAENRVRFSPHRHDEAAAWNGRVAAFLTRLRAHLFGHLPTVPLANHAAFKGMP
jgi:hypothetical protein